jgi:hypothetical protein
LIEALDNGFDVEFDLWYFADMFWLGHDRPDRKFSMDTLVRWSSKYSNQKLYVHCKNIWAIEKLTYLVVSNMIPFFHDVDQCILLRDNTIWIHPNAIHSCHSREKSIAVFSSCKMIEYDVSLDLDFKNFYGICTDYPVDLRNSL